MSAADINKVLAGKRKVRKTLFKQKNVSAFWQSLQPKKDEPVESAN
jgi:hypothetical protein